MPQSADLNSFFLQTFEGLIQTVMCFERLKVFLLSYHFITKLQSGTVDSFWKTFSCP